MNNKIGILTGIGLGPGDPSLMTVAARDMLMVAKVVAYIHANGRTSIARNIANDFISKGVKEIAIPVDMSASQNDRRGDYDNAVAEIISELSSGNDVVFLCEGDPLFYGSFVHLAEKVSEKTNDNFIIKSIPGVSSIHGAASAASISLASDNETFSIIPATLGEVELGAALARPGAMAIIKIGSNLEKLKRLLKLSGRLAGVTLVTNASGTEEKIENLADVSDASYFSLALVPAVNIEAHPPKGVAIVVVNKAGFSAGFKLKKELPGAKLLARFDGDGVDEVFSHTPDTLKKLFINGTPIVAFASSGIVIRSLAGLLKDKKTEPPVVAMSANGVHALPLLGGHNGANRLAVACADALGGVPAITTASEVEFGIALDDLPAGWHLANPLTNPCAAKGVTAAMLDGKKINLSVEAGSSDWLINSDALFNATAQAGDENVLVTPNKIENPDKTLVLHPPVLALGVGCERGCDGDELYSLAIDTLSKNNLSIKSIASVCSLDLKSDESAVLELAKRLDVPARFFNAAELELQTPRLANPSDVVFAEVGCHGVAEGAALASVGSDGKLVVEKQKSHRATVAVGLSPTDIIPKNIGRGQGRLYIVGTGPGRDGWRTPDATRILSMVTDVVGYELYLDIVADLIVGKIRHTSQLAEEEARVRKSLELAAEGRDVALVSSGDPGIYAMAALAFELLDRENKPEWNRLHIEVAPGISAFQAAASKIGAPMGHDFCLISLSDLLTPWEIIEKRLLAAASGGFAVAFYNPVSKRRTHQLETARDILLSERDPATPVVLGRNLGRDGESIRVITLGELTSKDADMLTMVIVGGPETRTITRGQNKYVYTPRGYEKKMGAKK